MLGLVIVVAAGFVGLMIVWKLIEGGAELAGNLWRKLDPQERARQQRAREYLRAHPDAIRAPWRDYGDED